MKKLIQPNKYNWPLIDDGISAADRKKMSEFCLKTKRFTSGEKVEVFEKQWSNWLGIKYSTMVNSGASANFVSIAIVKHLKGLGEIIVPPLGWVTDVSSIVQLGMTPVFVDISFENLSITYEKILKAITKKTKAIVLIHTLGFNALNEKILKIAKKKNLLLIEDCCEAHGAKYNNKKVGTYGDLSLFSFYFGHHMTTIEGGMVCCNDNKLQELSKMFRSHGMIRETSIKTKKDYAIKYPYLNPLFTFGVAGFNFRSTELNAVLGINQLKKLDGKIELRKKNLSLWLKYLNPNIFYINFNIKGNSNFALPLVLRNKDKFLFKNILQLLKTNNIEYRVGTAGGGGQHIQPYLEKFKTKKKYTLPNTIHIHFFALYIGNHPKLTKSMIMKLAKQLNNV